MKLFSTFEIFNLHVFDIHGIIINNKGCDNVRKVELHLHFDGSLNVSYTNKLLGYDASSELIDTNSTSLSEYLEKFELPIKLLQDLDNIEMYAYLLAKELEKDEVIYAEVRFCPLLHIEKHSIEEVVQAMKRGFSKVSSVKINLIFCMMRNFSFEENYKIIELTKRFLGNGVVAIDLAGDEAKYKTKDFKELFDIINKENIPFTIHAGEADGYESVIEAILFGAKRIGHGIRSIESEAVMSKLCREKITLEICPTSNINTKSVLSMEIHPIKKLMDNGILVTINTDNRTVSNTTLTKEYEELAKAFKFTEEDFVRFNLNAIDCAFISEEEKAELRVKLINGK